MYDVAARLGPETYLALARATYAAYNGGPGHLSRYRKPKTSPHLQTIDREFWRKYEALRAGDKAPMFSCYPTER